MTPNERSYCSKETVKAVKGVNTVKTIVGINVIGIILELVVRLKTEFVIEYPSIYQLLTVIERVHTKGRLISVYGVSTRLAMCGNPRTRQSVREALNRLCDKGLLYCVIQKNGLPYYGPTKLAVDIIDQYPIILPEVFEQLPIAC